MKISALIILIVMNSFGSLYAQSLHKVCPVLLKKGTMPDSVSFVLTTADYNFFIGKTVKYASSIEIIDADAPWPPRWYAFHPSDTSEAIGRDTKIMLNASFQSGGLSFFTPMSGPGGTNNLSILSLDQSMNISGAFIRPGKMIDGHDFKKLPNGGMAYFMTYDTIMDLRNKYNNDYDSAVRVSYENIEITDPQGKVIFSWNPLQHFGFDASYLPYRYAPGVMSSHSFFEWSHSNSISYDYDGNILYSYKHIGIGKISATDGHLIWHIERNKQKSNKYSDAIPIYLHHDLQAIKDAQGHVSYTVLSNGDSLHPVCRAYRFTVDFNEKGEQIVKLVDTYSPSVNISNTGGGGNFDEDRDGDYLMNYGLFKQDPSLTERPLFEYKDAKNKSAIEYSIASPLVFSYRIHKMDSGRPPRPVIEVHDGRLFTDMRSDIYAWYELSGADMKTVTKVSANPKYIPKEDGYYCVAVKYGMGWAVSKPYKYTKP